MENTRPRRWCLSFIWSLQSRSLQSSRSQLRSWRSARGARPPSVSRVERVRWQSSAWGLFTSRRPHGWSKGELWSHAPPCIQLRGCASAGVTGGTEKTVQCCLRQVSEHEAVLLGVWCVCSAAESWRAWSGTYCFLTFPLLSAVALISLSKATFLWCRGFLRLLQIAPFYVNACTSHKLRVCIAVMLAILWLGCAVSSLIQHLI